MRSFVLCCALLLTAGLTVAEDSDLTALPGYVDLGALSGDYGEPRVMINLGGSLLKIIGSMPHKDPVARETLRSLESVRVNVYSTAGNTRPAAERMNEVSKTLAKLDWEPIVHVREPDEQVDIYVNHGENRIHGVTVMAVDAEEAVFINILGDINPSKLAALMEQIDVDVDLAMAEHP